MASITRRISMGQAPRVLAGRWSADRRHLGDPAPRRPSREDEAPPEGRPATLSPASDRPRPVVGTCLLLAGVDAAPPLPTTDAIAGLMDDLYTRAGRAAAPRRVRRENGGLGCRHAGALAGALSPPQVQLRPLGVALGIESRSLLHASRPSPVPTPARLAGDPDTQALSEPLETHPIPRTCRTSSTRRRPRSWPSMSTTPAMAPWSPMTCWTSRRQRPRHTLQEVEL